MEALMSSTRAAFVSGIILGVAVGLVLGHLTLWGRSDDPHAVVLGEPMPMDQFHLMNDTVAADTLVAARTASLPPELMPVEESSVAAADSPFFEAIAMTTEESTHDATGVAVAMNEDSMAEDSIGDAVRTAQAPAEKAPNALNVAEAVPIHNVADLTPNAEPNLVESVGELPALAIETPEMIRSLINSELPDATETQREIWFDSLKDLKRADATGVLRMWKLVGGPIGGSVGVEKKTVPMVPLKPAKRMDNPLQELISQAIQIHATNIAMANVPGYKCAVPEFVQNQTGEIEGLISTTDFSIGSTIESPGFLDTKIEGPGMFALLREDGTKAYTRNGRLSIDADRRLGIRIARDWYPLAQGIVLPDPAGHVMIGPEGEVYVTSIDKPGEEPEQLDQIKLSFISDQQRLTSIGNGLFQLEDGTAVHDQVGGSLQMMTYESSNVDIEKELAAIGLLKNPEFVSALSFSR